LFKNEDKEKATLLFEKYLPLISFETYLGDCRSCSKAILKHLGIIKCDYTRGPQQALWDELVKKQLFAIVDRLDIGGF
jgi:dihydrodipicolinate synthase/N-acetylneuraminate lyase